MSKQRIEENKSKLIDGDDSSDSDGLYEDPTNATEALKETKTGDQVNQQVYCIEFRKKKGSMASFLEFFRSFKHECFKLSNAETMDSNPMEK
jgi:hypothetical protein